MFYINKQSYLGLLGPHSKNIFENEWLASWEVGKKKYIVILDYDKINYDYINAQIPYRFLYFEDIFEKLQGQIKHSKEISIETDIEKWNCFIGKSWRRIRNSLNRANEYNIEIRNNYNEDIEKLIKAWRENLANKYFQDHSGKSIFFYKMGYHKDCINRFYYINNEIVGFGCLSKPINGYASYIAGKCLCDRYYGLSEFIDCDILKYGKELGINKINWGQGAKGVLAYKEKFPNSKRVIHYNGQVE